MNTQRIDPSPRGGKRQHGKAVRGSPGWYSIDFASVAPWIGHRSFGRSLSEIGRKDLAFVRQLTSLTLCWALLLILRSMAYSHFPDEERGHVTSIRSHSWWTAVSIQMVLWLQSLCAFCDTGLLPKRVLSNTHLWKAVLEPTWKDLGVGRIKGYPLIPGCYFNSSYVWLWTFTTDA